MVYVFLADGFEDIEAIATVDVLRRADIAVKTVGIGKKKVVSSHNVEMKVDISDNEITLDESIDAIVLPGGMPGTTNLANSQTVKDAVEFSVKHKKFVCAICAAPSVIGQMGILSGKEVTCYPGFEKYLLGAKITKNKVCCCDNIITANGPGSTIDFSLEIVKHLKNEAISESVGNSMMYY